MRLDEKPPNGRWRGLGIAVTTPGTRVPPTAFVAKGYGSELRRGWIM
jgi:hypothetical protein